MSTGAAVRAVQGVLISCDVPTRQFILHLNKKRQFVLNELDETHLFVEASAVQEIRWGL
ncbi:unnamed protein product, partial [Phaeothamnion confervicola]